MPQWLLVLLVFLPAPGHAVDAHDEALVLRRAGKVVPLQTLLHRIRQQQPCRLLDVRIRQDEDRYFYRILILDRDNRVRRLEFDAGSGELIHWERGP